MVILKFDSVNSTQSIAVKILGDITKYNISMQNLMHQGDELLSYLQSLDGVESVDIVEGASNTLCIMAKNQTNGVGRLNRNWQGVEGNFFATFVFQKSNLQMQNYSLFGYYACFAMLNAIKKIYFCSENNQQTIQLKWPNDILINEKKACGMLIQSYNDFIICGIGVNVLQNPNVENILYQSCCIADFVNGDELCFSNSLQNLAINFVLSLEKNIALNFVKLCENFCQNAYKFNENICVNIGTQKVCGIFVGISKSGELQLQQPDKSIINVSFGDVGALQ